MRAGESGLISVLIVEDDIAISMALAMAFEIAVFMFAAGRRKNSTLSPWPKSIALTRRSLTCASSPVAARAPRRR